MAAMTAGDNPFDHDVAEVNAYLKTADADERTRVLDLESADAGKQRRTIIDGPYGAGGVSQGSVTQGAVEQAVIVRRPGSVDQAEADERALAQNDELEAAGVNGTDGFVGQDASSLPTQ